MQKRKKAFRHIRKAFFCNEISIHEDLLFDVYAEQKYRVVAIK